MAKHNQKVGRWGEQAAADFLSSRGYEIIARNVRTPYGEIDLVAQRGGAIVFVEVKARTTKQFGLPEQAITNRKAEHLSAAAEYYAVEHDLTSWQIDAVSVEGNPGGEPRITHFENVVF